MAHTFEITWHGEDTGTMRAQANSPDVLAALRSLISADPALIISSVTEFDHHGVAIIKRQGSEAVRPLIIATTGLTVEAAPTRGCASGIGPFLCSRFPQCGHSPAVQVTAV
ncbi:hypothetical protein [Streptomyces sp. NPDC093223]|uniref:hypothetical protein n=1 Tax=Streptomyces sp. NPDC093223 TaxID=3366033 RepID=UPI003823DFA8